MHVCHTKYAAALLGLLLHFHLATPDLLGERRLDKLPD
jgi:hypothetical protein